MLNEIYEIRYTTGIGNGIIRLDCSAEGFDEKLRVVEQVLADSHAKDITYTRRPRRADDFPIDDDKEIEQLSFLLG
ncbi:MAG: hypothetical protein NC218_01435 [Acetobacter sp.]|nr:hypothetical protein [Acetobacter sp.]